MPGLTDRALEVGAINYSLDGTAGRGTVNGDIGYSYALVARAGRAIEGNWLGVQIDPQGGPTGLDIQIQGSLDAVNWYPIGSDYTSATGSINFLTNIAVLYVRAKLVSITGGTGVKVSFTQ